MEVNIIQSLLPNHQKEPLGRGSIISEGFLEKVAVTPALDGRRGEVRACPEWSAPRALFRSARRIAFPASLP
jgi:hypothetical protein